MDTFINAVKLTMAAIGGVLGMFFGNMDGAITALICFVAVDYITGIMKAIKNKQLSSEVGFSGIARKIVIFLLVGVGNIIDAHLIKNGSTIRTAVIFFYIANEGISLLENTTELGLPYPQKLKDVLSQLKDDNE